MTPHLGLLDRRMSGEHCSIGNVSIIATFVVGFLGGCGGPGGGGAGPFLAGGGPPGFVSKVLFLVAKMKYVAILLHTTKQEVASTNIYSYHTHMTTYLIIHLFTCPMHTTTYTMFVVCAAT